MISDAPFWTQTVEDTARRLACTTAGLTSSEAAIRLKHFGRNADAETRQIGPAVAVARRLVEPVCLILIVAAIVSAATGDRASALIILVIVGASVALDTLQEGRAKRAADLLRQSVAVQASVERDGSFVRVDAETVVPGDVFRVVAGDIIPADALVMSANAFTANEAALTGEAFGVVKRPGVVAADTPPKRAMHCFAVRLRRLATPSPWPSRQVPKRCSARLRCHLRLLPRCHRSSAISGSSGYLWREQRPFSRLPYWRSIY